MSLRRLLFFCHFSPPKKTMVGIWSLLHWVCRNTDQLTFFNLFFFFFVKLWISVTPLLCPEDDFHITGSTHQNTQIISLFINCLPIGMMENFQSSLVTFSWWCDLKRQSGICATESPEAPHAQKSTMWMSFCHRSHQAARRRRATWSKVMSSSPLTASALKAWPT